MGQSCLTTYYVCFSYLVLNFFLHPKFILCFSIDNINVFPYSFYKCPTSFNKWHIYIYIFVSCVFLSYFFSWIWIQTVVRFLVQAYSDQNYNYAFFLFDSRVLPSKILMSVFSKYNYPRLLEIFLRFSIFCEWWAGLAFKSWQIGTPYLNCNICFLNQ